MTDYEYLSMDSARKIYVPSSLESEFQGKKFLVLKMPDGDIILHPITKSKNPLEKLRRLMKKEKRTIQEIKTEILETAAEKLYTKPSNSR